MLLPALAGRSLSSLAQARGPGRGGVGRYRRGGGALLGRHEDDIESTIMKPIENLMDAVETLMPTPAFMGRGRMLGRVPRCRIDIEEMDKEYAIHVEMPGVKKENVTLKANDDDGTITVRAGTEEATEDQAGKQGRNYLYCERFAGEMERTFSVPPQALLKDAMAELEHGVLTIKIPKSDTAVEEEPSGRMIEIK
jgi:HSP20 family molecular chaperone IbpA